MTCCCCFLVGAYINLKYVVSVKKNLYRAVFTNEGATKTPSNLPSVNLSPSYSVVQKCSQPGNQGFTGLLSMGKFTVLQSQDMMDCYNLMDASGQQVCAMKQELGCCSLVSPNIIFMDNQGNELIRVAEESNQIAPQGSRKIGTIKYCCTCFCSSCIIYGKTSNFHLEVKTGFPQGRRFVSSKDGREVAQVFTTRVVGGVVNGFFPPDLELGMKVGVIAMAVGQLITEIARSYRK